jgi:1-acyl-sn-glycerol-3-phosphate acyltransferase
MGATILAVVRLMAFAGWTLIGCVIWWTGLLVLAWNRRVRIAWRGFIVRTWARGILGIMGVRLEVKGVPPSPPFCLVSNHLSYLDIVLYLSRLTCVFIAKAEVRHWPILGGLARMFGTVFIDRRVRKDVVRVNALIRTTLQAGDGIIFFPEGTSSCGAEVLPFRSSLLDPLACGGFPVSYASVHYETPSGAPPAHLAACWWGDMTFSDHFFNMLKINGFKATIVFGSDTIQDGDRKVLAQKLYNRLNRIFRPVLVTNT